VVAVVPLVGPTVAFGHAAHITPANSLN
jgi:hypothetical protein